MTAMTVDERLNRIEAKLDDLLKQSESIRPIELPRREVWGEVSEILREVKTSVVLGNDLLVGLKVWQARVMSE